MPGVFWLHWKRTPAACHATPTPADLSAMARALELAADAAADHEVPVGAVVYETRTGEILGQGRNDRERAANPAGHAEMHAVLQAARRIGDWRLDRCTLVVTLEPCPMCAGLAVNARIGRLVYGAPDPKAGACGSVLNITANRTLNHRPQVVSGVRAQECAALLRAFFRSLRDRNGDA